MEFDETGQEASTLIITSTKFLDRSENRDGRPGLYIGLDIFDISSATAERNLKNLDRNQVLKVLFQLRVCVYVDRKTKMTARASDWLGHFRLLSLSIKLVFSMPSMQKIEIADFACDWPRHFWLLLCNCSTEFDETRQKASTQRPLPSLCFFRAKGKQRWHPWSLIGWDSLTSPLQSLNQFWRNLTL